MKKHSQTKLKEQFVIIYYKLKKVFPYTREFINYENKTKYEDAYMFNASSYVKTWSFKFNNMKSLKEQLRYSYNDDSVDFYTSIEAAVKNNVRSRMVVVIKKLNNFDDETIRVHLKLIKRKQPKKTKGKIYYCDCFMCTGMEKEKRDKIVFKDEMKINN